MKLAEVAFCHILPIPWAAGRPSSLRRSLTHSGHAVRTAGGYNLVAELVS
jgi:hypothetical protein